jgi:hypothetical protein
MWSVYRALVQSASTSLHQEWQGWRDHLGGYFSLRAYCYFGWGCRGPLLGLGRGNFCVSNNGIIFLWMKCWCIRLGPSVRFDFEELPLSIQKGKYLPWPKVNEWSFCPDTWNDSCCRTHVLQSSSSSVAGWYMVLCHVQAHYSRRRVGLKHTFAECVQTSGTRSIV